MAASKTVKSLDEIDNLRSKDHEKLRQEARAERDRLQEEQLNAPKEGSPNPAPEPPDYDNPENPRGIPDVLCAGMPDSQATDAQKVQNPTPARPPLAANMDPPVSVMERVSAGQNRKPPQEVIP